MPRHDMPDFLDGFNPLRRESALPRDETAAVPTYLAMCAARRAFAEAFVTWLDAANPSDEDARAEARASANQVNQLPSLRLHR